MDKLEQIKETIEESAELLDKQPEYHFNFDEFIRIIQDNDYDYDRIKSVRLNHEDWLDTTTTTYLNHRRYNNEWYPETDVRYYWDRQYRTDVSPIWTDTRIRTNTQATTSGSDAVSATPRHHEEWCDFVTDDAIQF